MSDLAIIIVSWNVCDLLRDCLRGVAASLSGSDISYDVIVVDNGSNDGTPAMVRDTFSSVQLLETGRNLGFAGANNLALRQILATDADQPRYVMLLNPDTLPQKDALAVLVRYLDAHPELVAVGPQLRYGDGSVQSSRRRFPSISTFFWESTPLERLWPRNPWARRYRCDDTPDSIEQRVGWLVGAALLVRTTAIAQAGLLDEQFFMYSEELEWQMRLQKSKGKRQKAKGFAKVKGKGQKVKEEPWWSFLPFTFYLLPSDIAYLPSAVITHYEGRSSEQALAGRHVNFQQSKLRLARMLYGRVFALVLRVFLLGCYTWELAVETAKLLLGHRRELRRQRIGVYAQVLRQLVAMG